jgi:hypothetical protein
VLALRSVRDLATRVQVHWADAAGIRHAREARRIGGRRGRGRRRSQRRTWRRRGRWRRVRRRYGRGRRVEGAPSPDWLTMADLEVEPVALGCERLASRAVGQGHGPGAAPCGVGTRGRTGRPGWRMWRWL